jgi:hypothetical protein
MAKAKKVIFNDLTVPFVPISIATKSYSQSHIAWEHNSGDFWKRINDDFSHSQTDFNSTRQFIKLEQSFNEQLETCTQVLNERQKYSLKEKFKVSVNIILNYIPDKVSLELTNEISIFYKIIKEDLNIYFEHYLIEEFDDTDEAIITVYRGNENVLNYGGSLENVIKELNTILAPGLMPSSSSNVAYIQSER